MSGVVFSIVWQVEKDINLIRNKPTTKLVATHYDQLSTVYNQGANRHCANAYAMLIKKHMQGCHHILELGGGSYPLSVFAEAEQTTVCDLSMAMLRHAAAQTTKVQCDAQVLPFPDAGFDGVVSVNLLEHVPNPELIFYEAARILQPEGKGLFITPNGDFSLLLEGLERLNLKLPEGPHRFIRTKQLESLSSKHFYISEHKIFLACPAVGSRFTHIMDYLFTPLRFGLFQYILLIRK